MEYFKAYISEETVEIISVFKLHKPVKKQPEHTKVLRLTNIPEGFNLLELTINNPQTLTEVQIQASNLSEAVDFLYSEVY